MNFFVFSLPRSGSAWLSVFLTGKDSFCYHELTAEKDWRKVPKRRRETIVGAVDTAAGLFANSIYSSYPKAKFFTLLRDKNEVNKSIRKLGFDLDIMDYEIPFHDPITYEKLNDIGYLAEIWAKVIGEGFDSERAKMLLDMNIQRDIAKFIAKINANSELNT